MVGPHCAVRVQLYHALWHFKRRVRGKLKKKLKESRAWLQVPCAPPVVHATNKNGSADSCSESIHGHAMK